MKKLILLTTLFASAISLSAEKMNVLFVLTDDMGKGDFSYYGNPHLKTPHVDKLASESYRFENYHTATTCAPTRSGLMSAMYCNKVGVWHTILGRSILDINREIMPEVFAKGGYATGMFGKWHLGDNYPYRPFDRGFQTTLWHKAGGIGQGPDYWRNSYFNPTLQNNDKIQKTQGFCTDVFFDAAIAFMKEKQTEGKPFLCYLALNAAHSPFNAPDKYKKKFEGNKSVPNAGFYGMIENIDDNMGKMESFLKSSGLDKNTIVIFSTDNGSTFTETTNKKTNQVVGFSAGLRDKKSGVYEGGHNVPFFMRIPNGKSVELNQLMGYIDVAPTLYELCGLKGTQKTDGISVKSVIDNPKSNIDRYLVGDTQRKELMSKDNISVVMKGHMRLVNRQELYDLSKDLGQTKNIAKDYPEMVSEMRKVHDEYWDYIAPENDVYHPIYMSTPNNEDVILNSHDRHVTCLHTQGVTKLQSKITEESFWSVRAVEDGDYTIEILRWTPETGLNFRDDLNNKNKKDTTLTGGELIIGDIKKTIELSANENPESIKFENIKLKKGDYKLFASYLVGKKKLGAYYVRIRKQ